MTMIRHALNSTGPVSASATVPAVRMRLAVAGLLGFGGLLLLCTMLMGGVATAGTLLAAVAYAGGLGLALRGLEDYPHPDLGACNIVTLMRLVLVCVLIGALVVPVAGAWAVFTVAVTALALDGVDGWLARRGGHVSDFGARFDVEVDGVLALVLALLAYTGGHAGVHIVALGAPLYLFRGAQAVMPWLRAELPPRFSRKVFCVVQIAVLIAVLVPLVDRSLADLLAAGAAAGLAWSFWVDIRWLWRARG